MLLWSVKDYTIPAVGGLSYCPPRNAPGVMGVFGLLVVFYRSMFRWGLAGWAIPFGRKPGKDDFLPTEASIKYQLCLLQGVTGDVVALGKTEISQEYILIFQGSPGHLCTRQG